MDRLSAAAQRAVQVSAILFAAFYLVSGILYLCLSYWNVTEQDFWNIYDFCLNHPWWESTLFKYNNHSIFFPSFIWLADLRFFHGRQVILFLIGLALLIISTSLLHVPIWRDCTLGMTAKCLATLTLVFGSFWMGRAMITTSGGFNCIESLVMLGTAAAFLLLPRMQENVASYWDTTTLIIGPGLLASFSFGTGLAIWPTLLFLGWYLRLPRRSLLILLLAALAVALIYRVLPPPDINLVFRASADSPGLISVVTLKNLLNLIGAPIFYSVTAWQEVRISPALIQSSQWLSWGGAGGLALAAIVTLPRLRQRKLEGRSTVFVGLALISFNLWALILVAAGRVLHFHAYPFEAVAPRYLFWSSLFWTGILLVILDYSQRKRWLRWPGIFLIFLFAIGGWQAHRDEGLHWRYARLLADESATSLINGVADPARLLAPNQEEIDILAPQLSARRLDMFAEGLQDWIGKPVSKLFTGRRDLKYFEGSARAERLVGGRDQPTAVKITGHLSVKEHAPERNMVVVDPTGTVVGIARSFHSDKLWNRLLYGNRMSDGQLGGYIRNYDPELHYVLRSVTNNSVSEQTIDIAPLPSSPTH